MIRPLRRRHRLIWAVLAPVVAALLAAALLSRPAPPLVDELPTAPELPPATAADTAESPPQDNQAPGGDEP